MSQCHDQYPKLEGYRPTGDVRDPEGAPCHDPAEISVLIAGSDEPTRSRIRQVLMDHGQVARVREVALCDEAVSRCDDVDVVVMGLRSRSGLGPLGAISQIARRPHHPSIVAISSRGETWLDQAARAEGADRVVYWPDDEPELVQAVVRAGVQAAQPVPI